jgi:hypothetical protein
VISSVNGKTDDGMRSGDFTTPTAGGNREPFPEIVGIYTRFSNDELQKE